MDRINIAAVQFKWNIEDYQSKSSFENRINSIMEYIRSSVDSFNPLLVVFPEDIGTPLLLIDSCKSIRDKKNFAQAARSLMISNLHNVLKYKIKHGVSSIRALLISKSHDMETEYCRVFSSAAKKSNAYIVAGSINLAEGNKDVYNISYFFSPDGKLIGKQKKVHLVDFEGKEGFDLTPGSISELKVFQTPFAKVGIAICLDAFKDDVINTLSSKGADILVQPSANNDPWNEWQQEDWLNGAYLAVYGRKKFRYGINAMMNGNIFDLNFEGQSSIISSAKTGKKTNYTLLKECEGFSNIAKDHYSEEIIIGNIPLY